VERGAGREKKKPSDIIIPNVLRLPLSTERNRLVDAIIHPA